jgi:ferrous iron transport protein A
MSQQMPLSMAHAGSTVSVASLHGSDETRRHLEELGFVEGAPVSVISQASGQVIVMIKGSRFGINEQTSRRVYVNA